MPTRIASTKAPGSRMPDGAPDPHRTLDRDEEDFVLQLLASAMGLPRLCVYKACRRRKRCSGPDIVCIAHHRGLVRKRWRAAVKLIAKPGR